MCNISFFIFKMILGWQANGESGRWRPGVPTSQMCFLSERLGADVSLPVPRQNHTVPGDLKFIDFENINWSVNYLLWEHKSTRHLRLDWSNTKEHRLHVHSVDTTILSWIRAVVLMTKRTFSFLFRIHLHTQLIISSNSIFT